MAQAQAARAIDQIVSGDVKRRAPAIAPAGVAQVRTEATPDAAHPEARAVLRGSAAPVVRVTLEYAAN